MKKVWNPLYIGIISYFCLVLPAVILWGINFRKLGRPDLSRPTFLIGSVLFAGLVAGWFLLPESWDMALEMVHVGVSIGGAAFQYPFYRRFMEEDEDNHQVESLLKPALLSVVFVLLSASLAIGWGWFLQHQIEKQLRQARDLYDTGDYPSSVKILSEIIVEDPGQRMAYVNLSIAYETMGKPDSAVIIMEDWLKQMPEDGEAKERIYQLRYQKAGN